MFDFAVSPDGFWADSDGQNEDQGMFGVLPRIGCFHVLSDFQW